MKKFAIVLILVCCAFVAALPLSGQTIFKEPSDAATTLYKAWRARNRSKAENAADAEAVKKLFTARRRTMKFTGCTKREKGDFECIYKDRKNDLTLAMLTRVTRRGFRIRSLRFSGEAY